MAKSELEQLKNLLKQARDLDAKFMSGQTTPRSFETRNKTIRTKINKILYKV